MIKVIAFGSFDPIHEGHIDFLRQAKELGDHLLVVIARESSIFAHKGYEPHYSEEERLAQVAEVEYVDEAILGNETAHKYKLLEELDFDVLVLGYDQEPTDNIVREELDKRGKNAVKVVRLQPFQPEKYKSTYIRRDKDKPT